MTGAIVLTLGHPAHHREKSAFELVNTFLAHVDEALGSGKLRAFRWYGFEDGDLTNRAGLMVLEGTPEQLDDFAATEAFQELRYGAPSFLQAFRIDRARPPEAPGDGGTSMLATILERWGLVSD